MFFSKIFENFKIYQISLLNNNIKIKKLKLKLNKLLLIEN